MIDSSAWINCIVPKAIKVARMAVFISARWRTEQKELMSETSILND